MINNEKEIVNTTYYKSYMDVIKAFEKANMLENLRLSCHPERKNAERFEVEVLRRRSKTKERSDDGVS